jgi:hypothetical protein
MNIIEKIKRNKDFIATELYQWTETFEFEYDEYGEKTLDSYNFVYNLAEKLENNVCSQEDYKNIEFHIQQINYNNVIIKL